MLMYWMYTISITYKFTSSLLHQPAVSPPFAVETPTATYIFHVDACSPFFGETLFLPLFSDFALSLAFSECFIFAILLHDNSPVSTFNTC